MKKLRIGDCSLLRVQSYNIISKYASITPKSGSFFHIFFPTRHWRGISEDISCITIDQTNEKEQQATEVDHAALPLSSAVRTGLEPATSGVTGRHSNQLNYRTKG